MPRLTSLAGVTVNVSEEKANQLRSIGYSDAEKADESKAAAKKSTAKKSAK